MSGHLGRQFEALLAAPLRVDRAVERLGRSLWLYVSLVSIANDRGLAVRNVERLAAILGVAREQVEAWLARLNEAGLVEIQSPPPFLVARLRFWPDEAAPAGASRPLGGDSVGGAPVDVPVGGSNAAAAASNKQREEEGAGEGETLFAAVVSELGPDQDPEAVRSLFGRYPISSIRRALRRVQETPPGSIRRSKAALFRYLLDRLA